MTDIRKIEVAAYKIPTDAPEADGTLHWEATNLVVVHIAAGGHTGVGYTYADKATAVFIDEVLSGEIIGKDAMDIVGVWEAMVGKIRNHGRSGVASMAIAAVDIALWDLKAKLLELPLVRLLGACRSGIEVYGSGGFTAYPVDRLRAQLAGWAEQGMRRVKMKVGEHPEQDRDRVRAAREAIGPDVGLFVDGNGAYTRKQALEYAEIFAGFDVRWFEEPVSSDDLEGLRLIRDRAPAGMAIAAGEYGYHVNYFRRMLEAGAVDCLQADVSRCSGITGFLQAGALCEAWNLPLSAHTVPSVHAHACCAVPRAVHLEYFHDHVRIENLLFDGVLQPVNGVLRPDRTRCGLGIAFRRKDAESYRV